MEGHGVFAEAGVLSPTNDKVADGLKYHVCDVWVDGMVKVKDWRVGYNAGVMKPVENLATGSLTKSVRERAMHVLQDEKLREDGEDGEYGDRNSNDGEGSDFEGFAE